MIFEESFRLKVHDLQYLIKDYTCRNNLLTLTFLQIVTILKPQALSTSKLSSLLGILFYVQCLPIIFNNMAATNNRLYDPLFYWSTGAHPLSRFPVFMMGMVAGVLRLRGTSHTTISPFILNIFHDILPWHTAYQEDTENTRSGNVYLCSDNNLTLI